MHCQKPECLYAISCPSRRDLRAARGTKSVSSPGDVLEHLALQDEEATVDPALAELRLLGDLDDLVAVQVDVPEAGRRADGGQRGELSRVIDGRR